MIAHELMEDAGIVVVSPLGPLSERDFADLSRTVDAFLETHEGLRGLMIRMPHFSGWENFGGLVHHFEFVKGHHKEIGKVALVTDTRLASLASHLASHFVAAEVRWFAYDDNEEALAWIEST